MTKRRLATLAVMATLGLGAAACGDDDESQSTAATPQAETPAASATPAAPDIVALAQDTPELSTLVEAVTAADLAGTLSDDGPFTVFAPTNDAFAAVPDGQLNRLLRPANQDQLSNVLTYHVVSGAVMAGDLQDGQTVETLQGETLVVAVDGDTVTVGGAEVVQPDVSASNGVVHVIDSVLLPEA